MLQYPHYHLYRVEEALGGQESVGEQGLEPGDQLLLRVDHVPGEVPGGEGGGHHCVKGEEKG